MHRYSPLEAGSEIARGMRGWVLSGLTWAERCGLLAAMRVHYFSGTGNARRVALWLAGDEGQICEIGSAPAVLESGLNGVVFPVHGFTTIAPMLRFLGRLPRADHGARVFVAAVTGGFRMGKLAVPGWEGTGLLIPWLILRAKGYRVVGARAFHFTPENWTSLIPAPAEADCRRLMEQTRAEVAAFGRELETGTARFRGGVSAFFGLAVLPVSLGYLLAARFALPKLFFAGKACSGCGVCAAICPRGAIQMKAGRPFWTLRCESCMRCMNYCPSRAIQASQLVAAGSIAGMFWLADWLGGVMPRGLAWILGCALAGAGLAAFYPVWFAVMRWKTVCAFFEFATLTRWYRRYREPETQVTDFRRKL